MYMNSTTLISYLTVVRAEEYQKWLLTNTIARYKTKFWYLIFNVLEFQWLVKVFSQSYKKKSIAGFGIIPKPSVCLHWTLLSKSFTIPCFGTNTSIRYSRATLLVFTPARDLVVAVMRYRGIRFFKLQTSKWYISGVFPPNVSKFVLCTILRYTLMPWNQV